jgi:predicted dehydrogenase
MYCRRFLNNTDPNGVLTAVCESVPEKRAKAAEKLSGVTIFENYNDMFDSGLIDVAFVVTPHYDHATIAIEAFKKGLSVLIDKPAGVEVRAIKELNEVAKQYPKQTFGIMYNQRTNKQYIKAKEIIDSGELGELIRINWIITDWYRPQAYYDQGGWRGTWNGEGGGVLINQCPHQLDLLTWFAGVPTRVKSITKTVGRSINVENDVTAIFEFENGATGVFVTSTHDAPGTNRLEITGTGGKIIIEGMRKVVFVKNEALEPDFSKVNKGFMTKPKTKTIVYKKSIFAFIREWVTIGQHFEIVRNYSEVLLGKADKLIAPGEEGIRGLTLSNAIHLSGWLNKEVKIPINEDVFALELEKRKKEELNNSKKAVK